MCFVTPVASVANNSSELRFCCRYPERCTKKLILCFVAACQVSREFPSGVWTVSVDGRLSSGVYSQSRGSRSSNSPARVCTERALRNAEKNHSLLARIGPPIDGVTSQSRTRPLTEASPFAFKSRSEERRVGKECRWRSARSDRKAK